VACVRPRIHFKSLGIILLSNEKGGLLGNQFRMSVIF
jgi:hypothetical protein